MDRRNNIERIDPRKTRRAEDQDRLADEFRRDQELNGRNDSGPNPEVHGRELPPQN